MRLRYVIPLTLLALLLNACGNGGGGPAPDRQGPQAPINEPDTGIFNPPIEDVDDDVNDPELAEGGQAGGGAASRGPREKIARERRGVPRRPGQTPHNASSAAEEYGRKKHAAPQGGTPSDVTGGSSVAPEGAQPVPEPGTLILFGTGVAGLGASMLRRRRRGKDRSSAT